MPQPKKALPVDPAVERQERIDSVMNELRPKLDAMLKKMVETVVDKPEREELGAVEFELRDMGRDVELAQCAGQTSGEAMAVTPVINRVSNNPLL